MSSILTVSQINKYVSFKLKSDLKLKGIAVKGEISNYILHYKLGHIFFTLKDAECSIKVVMFSSSVARLKRPIEDGMSVLVVGNLEAFERDGVYQIIANDIQPIGAGIVTQNIEMLKKKLLENGVINEANKKNIPLVPKKIAVVTAKSAAALQDILTITGRRYPLCEILVFPTLVQGENASKSIADALAKADNYGADTIILARGGGSVEDLMPFNCEMVAMAVYNCNTPVISAVGHETDTTVVDYVADMRAPTPSAAAELCTPENENIIKAVNTLKDKLDVSINAYIQRREKLISGYNEILKLKSPIRRFEENTYRLDKARSQLDSMIEKIIDRLDNRLRNQYTALSALSPFDVLERGYSITTKNGRVVDNSALLDKGDEISIRFRNSSCTATVIDVNNEK